MIHQLRLILRPIVFINLILSCFMAFCGFYALMYNENNESLSFFKTMAVILLVSIVLAFFSKSRDKKTITIRSGFVLVVFIWVFTCIVGALPYYVSGSIPDIYDAFFESVSGFTTVGASILSDIEGLPKSIQLWRAISHGV